MKALRIVAVLVVLILHLTSFVIGTSAIGQAQQFQAPMTWDFASDFRVRPNQVNPSPDRYGNPRVWHYLHSTTLQRDPATYSLLPKYNPALGGVDGLEGWAATWLGPPAFVKNSTGEPQPIPGSSLTFPPDTVVVHPNGSQLAVLGWRSPVTGSITVTGGVRSLNSECGDGIVWSIDQASTNVASGSIDKGGEQAFSAGTGGDRLADLHVLQGDFLYIAIHPKEYADCDNTRLDVTITAPRPQHQLSVTATCAMNEYLGAVVNSTITFNVWEAVQLDALQATLEGTSGGTVSFTPNLVGTTLQPGTHRINVRVTNWTLNASVGQLRLTVAATLDGQLQTASSDSFLPCTPPGPCLTPPTGLVSWWAGDGTAADSVGGNHGTLQNGAGFSAGQVDQAFRFDGVNDHVFIPNTAALNPAEALTLDAWIYLTGNPVDGYDLISKDGEGLDRQYLLSVGTYTGRFRPHIGVPSGFEHFEGATTVEMNTWYHVAMTYDGSTLKLFVNGALDGSLSVSGPIIPTAEPVRIGGGAPHDLVPFYFPGLIDEVEVFNRALTLDEVQAIFIAGRAGKCKPTVPAPPQLSVTAGCDVDGDVGAVVDGTLTITTEAAVRLDALQATLAGTSGGTASFEPNVVGSTLQAGMHRINVRVNNWTVNPGVSQFRLSVTPTLDGRPWTASSPLFEPCPRDPPVPRSFTLYLPTMRYE